MTIFASFLAFLACDNSCTNSGPGREVVPCVGWVHLSAAAEECKGKSTRVVGQGEDLGSPDVVGWEEGDSLPGCNDFS